MIAALAIVIGAGIGLAWMKSWHRCPLCGHTFATTVAVARHIKKGHRT